MWTEAELSSDTIISLKCESYYGIKLKRMRNACISELLSSFRQDNCYLQIHLEQNLFILPVTRLIMLCHVPSIYINNATQQLLPETLSVVGQKQIYQNLLYKFSMTTFPDYSNLLYVMSIKSVPSFLTCTISSVLTSLHWLPVKWIKLGLHYLCL